MSHARGQTSAPPVRLLRADADLPFPTGAEVVLARVRGDGLRALDVRDGDRVVLARRLRAEHGDLAAVLDEHGRATLWKVHVEGERLRLGLGPGRPWRLAPVSARIHGVVVAVLRRSPRPPGGFDPKPRPRSPGPGPAPG